MGSPLVAALASPSAAQPERVVGTLRELLRVASGSAPNGSGSAHG